MVGTLKMAAVGLVIMSFGEMNVGAAPEIRRADAPSPPWQIRHVGEQCSKIQP